MPIPPHSTITVLSFFHIFLILHFSSSITAIRKDVSLLERRICRTTVEGRYLLSDDNGDARSLDPKSRCCPGRAEQYSCHGCDLVSKCCNSYEFCISCCLNPAKTQKDLALKVKIAKPITSGTYPSVFDFCSGRCRHNSESLVHENAYISDFHHCFAMPSNSSGITDKIVETKLSGISIIIGKQGESCESACKSKGQSCVSNKLPQLNQCEIMQKYMSCRGSCLASIGADQPAEVVEDTPKNLNPGACLYARTQSMLSCDGSHRHTKRLCPCA